MIESIQVHLPERERVLWIIGTSVIAILVLIVIQLRAFGRPPPVPPKELPKRPVLQILFKPDDISNARNGNETKVVTTLLSHQSSNDNNAFPSATSSTAQSKRNSIRQETGWRHRFRTSMGSFPNMMFGRQASAVTLPRRNVSGGVETVAEDEDEDDGASEGVDLSANIADHTSEAGSAEGSSVPETFLRGMDLPDSFAPLLSSSQMDVVLEKLTADLIHCGKFLLYKLSQWYSRS